MSYICLLFLGYWVLLLAVKLPKDRSHVCAFLSAPPVSAQCPTQLRNAHPVSILSAVDLELDTDKKVCIFLKANECFEDLLNAFIKLKEIFPRNLYCKRLRSLKNKNKNPPERVPCACFLSLEANSLHPIS